MVYKHFINNPHIDSGCFNAGFENISILDIANYVKNEINSEIEITESNDPRSYRQDSSKLLSTGFKQEFSVKNAILEIKEAYEKNLLNESDSCYTVKWMKKLKL